MAIDGMYKPTEEELELLKRWYAPDVSKEIASDRTNAYGMNVAQLAKEKEQADASNLEVASEDIDESPAPLSAQELDEISEQARQQGFDEGLVKGKEQGLANGYEEGYSQGVEQGVETGIAQGLEQGQQLIDQKIAVLDELVSQLQQPIEPQNQQIEQALVNLAMTLAQKVIHCEVEQNPKPLQQAIAQGLNLLGQQQPVTVKLHPQDMPHVQEVWSEQACHDRQINLMVDPSLEQGNCQLDSVSSSVSVDVASRCAQVFDDFVGQGAPETQDGPQDIEREKTDDA